LKSEIFNNSIGSPYDFGYPKLTKEQDRQIIAGLFEQLLVFDKITISTNRLNFGLFFLIDRLGLNTVERLFDYGYIKLMLWSPMILTGTGHKESDGTIVESVIFGQPPIVAGVLSSEDTDPENNIQKALLKFGLHRDRKRILTKRILKHYVILDGMEFSKGATKFIIDSYQNNNLSGLGLPFEKEPNELNIEQRKQILRLGHKVLETAILAKYNYKSYENYEHYSICKQNLNNIGKAYNIIGNTSEILRFENLPDLKSLLKFRTFI